MMPFPDTARAEAAALAGDLPGLLMEARRLAAAAPGAHGRRRAGQGEAFWQYRDHRAEEGARAVDWRRSARGDRLYVRERELDAAQSALFWIDPAPGFDWASDGAYPRKFRRALVVSLALATLFSRGGERIGALGGPPRLGARAVERFALDLISARNEEPPQAPARARVLLASDFYAPVETWRGHLARLAGVGVSGALLMIADPAEEDFPYDGRTLFHEVGGRRELLLGRAGGARAEFSARLAAHRRAMREMARGLGFVLLTHRTDHPAAPIFSALADALSGRAR